jgi:hypothetical protein
MNGRFTAGDGQLCAKSAISGFNSPLETQHKWQVPITNSSNTIGTAHAAFVGLAQSAKRQSPDGE